MTNTTQPHSWNRTWTLGEGVIREQICAGTYTYHTPVGKVFVNGDTGTWVLNYSHYVLASAPLTTLADCDAVVVETVQQVLAAYPEAGKA